MYMLSRLLPVLDPETTRPLLWCQTALLNQTQHVNVTKLAHLGLSRGIPCQLYT